MERLADLNLPVEVRYTPTVRSRIRQYVVEGGRDSEMILGRTAMYFPVFEHYLRLYRLPEALKYLPIVESTLRARATSHAGASGLWQFVPATARAMGLKVNGTVDERLDTYRATEAAVKMLAALHKEFGDWGIALTAYNCGPGRVRQAIRLAGRRDYWAIQRYLPRETQRYVPAFIAAAYLVNYYQHHGLHPDFPVYDMQETRVFRVYKELSLKEVANQCDTEYSMLRKLNQGYLLGYVPASKKGNFLIIPAKSAPAFMSRYETSREVTPTPPDRIRSSYVTVPGDEIETLSLLFRCSIEELMSWNQLRSAEVTVNQPLLVFLPQPEVRP